ncbi:MAG TPA: hypothetical protein VMV93_01875, partial [Chloroflexota bacterium]|nr:hypothetical protein [Chloroflexota bacterium]
CRRAAAISLMSVAEMTCWVFPVGSPKWHVFEDVKLPDGISSLGVIDSCTNYVEHPELVAERIVRLARLVGARARDSRHRLRLRYPCRA